MLVVAGESENPLEALSFVVCESPEEWTLLRKVCGLARRMYYGIGCLEGPKGRRWMGRLRIDSYRSVQVIRAACNAIEDKYKPVHRRHAPRYQVMETVRVMRAACVTFERMALQADKIILEYHYEAELKRMKLAHWQGVLRILDASTNLEHAKIGVRSQLSAKQAEAALAKSKAAKPISAPRKKSGGPQDSDLS